MDLALRAGQAPTLPVPLKQQGMTRFLEGEPISPNRAGHARLLIGGGLHRRLSIATYAATPLHNRMRHLVCSQLTPATSSMYHSHPPHCQPLPVQQAAPGNAKAATLPKGESRRRLHGPTEHKENVRGSCTRIIVCDSRCFQCARRQHGIGCLDIKERQAGQSQTGAGSVQQAVFAHPAFHRATLSPTL